ncbi:rhamnogalacturonan lyase [Streptomyces sp. CRN 30]|uniref:rhamnogalacturonan lyase n=1 Tax=Streptomyces sp. CRN 30 TaxID=3075613 RepID=UPI002A7F2596|nr:rhamnogalacturonan lyase [Streptomyces sp. CRN 30]
MRRSTTMTARVAAMVSLLAASLLGAGSATASAHGGTARAVQLEHLDRGLVAVRSEEGVFLSWRLLATEATGATKTGLKGADFRVYRNGRPLATVRDSTNFVDTSPVAGAKYQVAAVTQGRERDRSPAVSPTEGNYYELPLRKPADGVTPAGQAYTYRANDMSVGDVDGDGAYEYVVKWDPSNSKDVSQVGYTGNTYIDTYELDGTLRHRIDLGVNVRSGAHYTQFLVYDFDGDGRSEMMFKTAPGTKITRYGADGRPKYTRHITLPREDVRAGYSHRDDYRMSAEDYHAHLVEVFRGWSSHPQVRSGQWPATLEEALGITDRAPYPYPLGRAHAEDLADHFVDVYAPSRAERNKLREFEGFVVDGPEYLTVFDGATGAELETTHYPFPREDDGLLWGDYAGSRIEPGNRVDRFLAGVAYLDGVRPSAVFARGYYTRSTLAAYRWDGRHLRVEWEADSGYVPMDNPFRNTSPERDGTSRTHGTLAGQGFHSLSAADVDGDGRQEIVYGSATLDDDGSLLHSSAATMPEGTATAGRTVRLGHGDAMHVADIDPARPGLEIFAVHEGGGSVPLGYSLRDAATGRVLFGAHTGVDTGRGMIGDIDPDQPGLEVWAGMPASAGERVGLFTARGTALGKETPGTNQSIRWAADLTTQIVHGATTETYETPTVRDWRRGTLLTATDTTTNNHTKGNPSLVADVFGDWREELLLPTRDSRALRIHVSTEVTHHKLYTLMHDPQYRAEIARQQTVYNQPAYPGFYLASDTDFRTVPLPRLLRPGRS